MAPSTREQELAQRFLDVVPFLLHSLSSELRAVVTQQAPVTMAQFRSMAALHRGPRSLTELAEAHEVSAPTMSRLVSTLVDRGWVVRERGVEDRRQVILRLSPVGETVWDALATAGRDHLARLLSDLTSEEEEALGMALAGLARVVVSRRECTR